MPITLITGTPGAGKTLYAVRELVEKIIPTGRQIYVNIDGFTHDAPNVHVGPEGPERETWKDNLPKTWQEVPDGAFFVFDEVQRQYPYKNSQSKTPEYITGFETHRHQGKDFIFITQGPYLLDRHLHPLIDRHLHVYRPFGFKRSTVLEWQGVNPNPMPAQTRANAQVKNFRFPAKYFAFYKSATVHTVKVRLPWKLILGAFVLLAFIGWTGSLFYRTFKKLDETDNGVAIAAGDASSSSAATDPARCARIVGQSPGLVRVVVSGRTLALQRSAVAIDAGNLVVGGESGLAMPLCRATG